MSSTEFVLLLEDVAPHVLQVTLNRPAVANAFNTQMAVELFELFEKLTVDAKDTRCVVLTGAGERAFCAGGDLKERLAVPLIGAVNGAAYAGGCELALACDFLYAADHARFALTETSIGIIPGAGGTQTLPRAVGERRAKELILSATPFSATEAASWGLVNQVYPTGELLTASLAAASRIANNAPIAVRQAKQSIHRGMQMSLSDGLCFEIEAYNRTVPTKDRVEGVRAFNQKRAARFNGN